MIKDRYDLEIEIKSLFKLYSSDKDFFKELKNKTKNKMKEIRLLKYWNGLDESPLYISDLELCLLTNASYEIISSKIRNESIISSLNNSTMKIYRNIKVEDWFTESEIISMNAMYVSHDKKESKKDSATVFKDVQNFNNNNSWVTVITYGELIEIMETENIEYNFDTQRDPVITEKYGTILYQPFVDKDRVHQMSEQMKNGTFENNMITFNILDNGNATFTPPTDKDKNFYFFKDRYSVLNCIDGYHRCIAIQKAVSEKPELANDRIVLKITFYVVEKAQNVIKQESISTDQHLSNARKKAFQVDKISNTVKKINEYNSSEDNFLYDKISKTLTEVLKIHNKYVTFDVFRFGLEDDFEDLITGGYQSQKVTKYLVEFFNVVGYKFKDEFENIKESQKHNIITNNNTFLGYLAMARALYGQKNWEDRLIKFLEIINWDSNNEDWNTIKIFSSNLSKKRRDIIREYFKNIIEG